MRLQQWAALMAGRQGSPPAAALEERDDADAADAADADDRRLGDFTTDARLLVLTPMAAVIGVISVLVAFVLVWLIGAITNLVYYNRLSAALVSPAANRLGPWAALVPG